MIERDPVNTVMDLVFRKEVGGGGVLDWTNDC
jgi:hypothetical protein